MRLPKAPAVAGAARCPGPHGGPEEREGLRPAQPRPECQGPHGAHPAPRPSNGELGHRSIGTWHPLNRHLQPPPPHLGSLCWDTSIRSKGSFPCPQEPGFWPPLCGGHTGLQNWTPGVSFTSDAFKECFSLKDWGAAGGRDRSQILCTHLLCETRWRVPTGAHALTPGTRKL